MIATVEKKVEPISATPTTSALVDIAAGAARPTATIASAKVGSIWAKLLCAVTSNSPPLVSTRPRKSPMIDRAKIPMARKAAMAKGKRISTMLHNPGTKTRPTMNSPFTDMASASG